MALRKGRIKKVTGQYSGVALHGEGIAAAKGLCGEGHTDQW